MTGLELCDLLQEFLIENGMEDVRVVLETPNGLLHLEESHFRLDNVPDEAGYLPEDADEPDAPEYNAIVINAR